MSMTSTSYRLKELADRLGATYRGDADCEISGVATLQTAKPGQISFLTNPQYRKYLPATNASVVILAPDELERCPVNALITPNPYLAYAKIAEIFEKLPPVKSGIHPSAVIGENCEIDPTASVGPFCVIEDNVKIAAGVIIGAHGFIGANSSLGKNCRLWPRVTLYYGSQIGERVILHSGVVIGSDGFGNAQDRGRFYKVPQLGSTVVGNDVEIGANTTIDRGALEDTIIGDGVKLDNQIQVGHNVKIGAHCGIAGCVGIAGSATIGKYCMIGGGTGIGGHVEIADQVMITGMTMVTKSIKTPGVYSSGTGLMKNSDWHRSVVRFRQLDELAARIHKLESLLKTEESL